jgi:hypothetical protein
VPGLIAAALMMWIAWQHNAQGEIHNQATGIDWPYWLLIGASWFVVFSGIPILVSLVLWLRSRLFRRP